MTLKNNNTNENVLIEDIDPTGAYEEEDNNEKTN